MAREVQSRGKGHFYGPDTANWPETIKRKVPHAVDKGQFLTVASAEYQEEVINEPAPPMTQ